jgi:hypothetical protein
MSQNTLGALTKGIADEVQRLAVGNAAWRVYHDHGAGSQRLWAYVGGESHTWSNLSGVDVLLGDADSGEASLILEVEESACSPKRLLGDVCALALSACVTASSDNRRYAVTPRTELWVCYPANLRGHQRERNECALARLRESWGSPFPFGVRLIESDGPQSLAATVCDALRHWVGR